MKTSLGKLAWKIVKYFLLVLLLFAVSGTVWLTFQWVPDRAAQKAAADARQKLRDQGFKTDLTDFDFTTSPEMRPRAAVLKATAPDYRSEPFRDHPNLMATIGNDSAMVVWKQDLLKHEQPPGPDNRGRLSWENFRSALNSNQAQVDAACVAILSGPIGFDLDARGGNAVRLPHLSMMKNLAQTLGSRTVLDLHDGNQAAAWTNLLAETRLVTAWKPEPVAVSQLVRFAIVGLAYNATWQLLQTNGWTDEQLARLQTEWEEVDFFKPLPETAAFKRASDVAMCEQDRSRPFDEQFPLTEMLKDSLRHPLFIWTDLNSIYKHGVYLKHGSYADETNLLTFYRDRELELRNAIQAPTWSQMRALPGVTNKVFFYSKYHSRLQAMMNLHEVSLAVQQRGASFLGRAAEAEAQRRVLITAIALERYRGKNGSYPKTLAELAPEFMKTMPVDFMDGQPLRYRLKEDGHFLLYSVGLDCVDDGGIVMTREQRFRAAQDSYFANTTPKADIVWPRPASVAEINAVQQREQTARENRANEMEEMQANAEWNFTIKRQAEVEKLLAQSTKFVSPDTMYHGRPLAEVLRNMNSAGTNRLSLAELLTPHQIITGAEPETVTLEIPIAYDVLTNVGTLDLYVDPATNTDSDVGAYALQCEFSRATSGDCLLAWSTIYECPGKHALTMGLTLNDLPPDKQDFGGIMLPFEVTNLCQFSTGSAHFDPETGATWRARLPEKNASYIVECVTTNGTHLKTLTGNTTNGLIKLHWDLVDDHGQRLNDDFFNSVFHITLTDSGRTQTLKGP